MMQRLLSKLDKRISFLTIATLSAAIVAWKVTPVSMEPTVQAVISQQRGSVTSIAQPRSIASTKTFFVDSIDFPESDSLAHAKLGPLGFGNDFFIDLDAHFTTTERLVIDWTVESDDGFRLVIDGQEISSFPSDRPFSGNLKRTELAPGSHALRLSYFQGYGKLGLRASYQVVHGKQRLIGQSGDGVNFESFPSKPLK